MKTLGEQLRAHDNFGPGFNFARIALAYGVAIFHAVAVTYGDDSWFLALPTWPLIFVILPMFFALSGFLVTGSALRLPLKEYILNRVFRIVPALGVDIVFSAMLLGPIITTVAIAQYFGSPVFWSYFLNIVGWVHYLLPGVFEQNPLSGIVNGALWTVRYEIGCYVIMSLLIYTGLIRSFRAIMGLAVAIVAAALAVYWFGLADRTDMWGSTLRFAFIDKGATLIPAFLVGSAIYLAQDRIPYSGWLAAAVVVAFAAIGVLADPAWMANPILIGLSAFPLAYLVVWIGLTPIKIPAFLEKGDYSYGIYLYHFPILQLMQYLFGFTNWVVAALAAIVPVTLFAMFSWYWIEKPTLKMRKRFSLVGARLAS